MIWRVIFCWLLATTFACANLPRLSNFSNFGYTQGHRTSLASTGLINADRYEEIEASMGVQNPDFEFYAGQNGTVMVGGEKGIQSTDLGVLSVLSGLAKDWLQGLLKSDSPLGLPSVASGSLALNKACTAVETIDPAVVRFSQSSISGNFSTGGTIQDLAVGLRNGTINPADISPIRLVQQDGNLFTLDNRRLWGFQQAEVPVPYRMATPQEAAEEAWKFTTQNGGTTIRVRGQ